VASRVRKKKKTSASEFTERFAKIAERHLAALPEDEQDRRLYKALRIATSGRRGVSATRRGVGETQPTRLIARSRE
jgi:hypothetical protein